MINLFIFIFAGFVDPFSLLGLILGPEYFKARSGLCHLIGSVCLISCVCSLWTIAAISVNRYTLLCKRHLYPKIFTNQKTILISICLWALAFLLDLPNFLEWGDHSFDMKTMACSYDRLASYSYTVFFITMFVTVPLITVCVCNINIFVVFLKSRKRVRAGMKKVPESTIAARTIDVGLQSDCGRKKVPPIPQETRPNPSSNDTPSTQHIENDRSQSSKKPKQVSFLLKTDNSGTNVRRINLSKEFRLAKTLFVIFTVFCICWSPYALLCLIDPNDQVDKLVYVVTVQMAHSSSCLNSILYAAMNKSFRDGYVLFLSKIFRCFRKENI